MPIATQIRPPAISRYPEASASLIRAPSIKIGYLFWRPCRVPIAPGPCMHDRLALGAAKFAALHRPREQFLHSAIASATDRTGENHDGRHLSLTVPCKLARASLAGCPRQTAPASRATCRGRQPITVFPPDSLGACPEAVSRRAKASLVPAFPVRRGRTLEPPRQPAFSS